MKTTTKAKVIKYIKDHGEEGAFEWRATINGIKVGVCKSTIILLDEYTKFPSFTKVSLDEFGGLEFKTPRKTMTFWKTDRHDEIVDKYYKVMEDILNNV